jgi:hypothetical protein
MPEQGCKPTNKYLPPRPRKTGIGSTGAAGALEPVVGDGGGLFLRWIDKVLSR